MRFNAKQLSENKSKLTHAISHKKINGKAQDVNLQNSNIKEFIETLGNRMVKTCINDGGVGLAAPQLAIPKKVIVIKEFMSPHLWDFTDYFNLYINPTYSLIKESGEWEFEESCLSVPGKSLSIYRCNEINASYWAYDNKGELVFIEEKLEGYLARVFLHEVDHLLGISILDRFNNQTKKREEKTVLNEREQFLSNLKVGTKNWS